MVIQKNQAVLVVGSSRQELPSRDSMADASRPGSGGGRTPSAGGRGRGRGPPGVRRQSLSSATTETPSYLTSSSAEVKHLSES